MRHFEALTLHRFRRLSGVALEGFGAFNLLVGPNNSGKTSVLEALALACAPLDLANWIEVAWEREIKSARTPVAESLKWLFPQMGDGIAGRLLAAKVEIKSRGTLPYQRFGASYEEFFQFKADNDGGQPNKGVRFHLESLDWPPPPPPKVPGKIFMAVDKGTRDFEFGYFEDPKFDDYYSGPTMPHSFVSTVSHRTKHEPLRQLSDAIEAGRKNDIETALRRFDPSVKSLEIVSPRGQSPVVKVSHECLGLVPLSAEGDGMRRFLTVAAAAISAKGGVLLIDEIETALHTSALAEAFRYLVAICREHEVQLFATTHSLEAIDAMLAGAGEAVSDLVVFRLPGAGTGTPVKRFAGELARNIRSEHGSDLR